MIFEKVKGIILDTLSCAEEAITLEATLTEDLHLPGRKGCFSGPKHPLSRPSPVKGDCLSPSIRQKSRHRKPKATPL